MDHTKKSPSVLSLCPGIRGLERGLEDAYRTLGWNPPKAVAYVEIEAVIIENLVAEMELGLLDPAPIWSNLKTVPWHSLRGKIDLFTGGYPCQPFSVAGLGKGTEDPRHLWPYIAKGVDIVRPGAVFFENVRNHLNIGYDIVRRQLQEMGYRVREGIYSAEEAGAVHKRERLFILAIRVGVDQVNSERDNEGGYSDSRKSISPDETSTRMEEGRPALGDSQRWRLEGWNVNGKETEIVRSGCNEQQELADTGYSVSLRDNNAEGQQCGNGRHARGESSSCSSSLLSDSDSTGLSGSTCAGERCLQEERFTPLGCKPRGIPSEDKRVVARPGGNQFVWEHPRVIKPSLGCTTHGYNFREDLLRAFGNSVYRNTAKIAFIDLLKKHAE